MRLRALTAPHSQRSAFDLMPARLTLLGFPEEYVRLYDIAERVATQLVAVTMHEAADLALRAPWISVVS